MNLDRQFIDIVCSDTRHVIDSCNRAANHDSLRRISTQLHMLLLESPGLQGAWRMLGQTGSPRVTMSKMTQYAAERSQIAFASSVTHETGAELGQFFLSTGTLTPDEMVQVAAEARENREISFPLHEMLESAAVKSEGLLIRRRHIVKYVAVKRGGKHYDPKRDNKKSDDLAYKALDKALESGISLGGLTVDKMIGSIFHELMSIGQALGRSADIQKLLSLGDQSLSCATPSP